MKPAKNDPCPCGSGKIFEKCCQEWYEATKHKPSVKKAAPTATECNQLVALLDAGDYAELEARTRLLLERYPDSGFAWKVLGATLQMQSKDSLPALQKATEFLPNDAEAHYNLGITLKELGRLNEAEASYRRALQINPNFAMAHNNLGITLHDMSRLNEAEASYRQALRIKLDHVEALNNLGMTLNELGRIDEAELAYRKALQFKPDFAEAHYNLGLLLLLSGRLSEGWQEYEYRWEGSLPKQPQPITTLPQWIGQPTQPGNGILIFGEQGMGDKLQFSRYLQLAADRFAGRVSVIVDHPLLELFRRSFPDIEVLEATPADQSAWQWQCPLLSLPLAFNTSLETIPNRIPYLIPDLAKVARWKAKIAALDLPASTRKIGVVWKSGTLTRIAHLKGLPLEHLAPLLGRPDCAWFSLQKEPDPDKMRWVSSGKLMDWADEFSNFDETAALMMNLDLIVSVDTSVVHMAGALGRPTWLLNRHASDWRWMRDRENSPWYPTMRIFTQKTTGDWDEVVTRMSTALRESQARNNSQH